MPPRGRKRKSDQSVASEIQDAPNMAAAAGQQIATKSGDADESPNKRRRIGVTIAQKQALIDNLQLEVTERARKLRAQYNLQAQGLRTRIEIRVNRIPMALRKVKMGDLLQKHASDKQKPIPPKQTVTDRVPPPVPEKDFHPARSVMSQRGAPSPRPAHAAVGRPPKRLSDHIAGGDKENQTAHIDNPKKRQQQQQQQQQQRAAGAPGAAAQVLSPASSNSRLRGAGERPPSPTKSFISRPMSPTKQASATNLLSSMVEKARATRAATGAASASASSRKPTTSSTASSAAGGGGAASTARTRAAKGGAAAAGTTAAARSGATSRTAKRVSGISESSDASTSTVVRKAGRPAGPTASTARKATNTAAAAAPATKRTVMSSIKKGVASAATKKAPAAKAATVAATTTSATTRSGRVLRKRE